MFTFAVGIHSAAGFRTNFRYSAADDAYMPLSKSSVGDLCPGGVVYQEYQCKRTHRKSFDGTSLSRLKLCVSCVSRSDFPESRFSGRFEKHFFVLAFPLQSSAFDRSSRSGEVTGSKTILSFIPALLLYSPSTSINQYVIIQCRRCRHFSK